ncbi:hypothetical protein PYW08_012240 [Mythimna loreyi]|uniref:Uncharacterized protein n=1 Tax=Mythimna loreyi TaxID=667449 RepID=A0ACC2PZN6_9NEOP|nr:hypothetical protein PYW08_012240 [Mythimna loreyi]
MQPARTKPTTRGGEFSDMYFHLAFGITVLRLLISALYTVGGMKPNLSTQSYLNIFMCHFSIPILIMFIKYILNKIATPVYIYDAERRLVSTYDLKLNRVWVNHLHDITVIIVLTHVLSVISNIFLFILLFLPLRALYLAWKLFVRPFLIIIFTDQESDTEKNKKKSKKTGKKKIKYLRTIKHWHHFK